eukprot:6171950-Pleurochrysis_carterae.AAC.1
MRASLDNAMRASLHNAMCPAAASAVATTLKVQSSPFRTHGKAVCGCRERACAGWTTLGRAHVRGSIAIFQGVGLPIHESLVRPYLWLGSGLCFGCEC